MESRILSNMKFDPGILIIGVTILTVILLVMVIVMLRRQNSLAKSTGLLCGDAEEKAWRMP